jgi:hypothetical protein
MLEPPVETPKVKGSPASITLGPYEFRRDRYGNWSRNRLNPGLGMREFALDAPEALLAEEVLRLRALAREGQ